MDKLAALVDFLNRYCVAYQTKYSMPSTSQVTVEMLAKDAKIKVHYLIPSATLEPVIEIGEYWTNSYTIRKCVSSTPSGQLQHTYQDINDFNAEFGYDVQLVSESIDVGPNAPIPEPVTIPGKGSFVVSDGTGPVNFLPSTDGFAIVADSNSDTGLSYRPIVTMNGVDVLNNKTVISPKLDGVLSGTAILNEDNMVSAAPNKVPTQRSVKRYVDNTIAGSITTSNCLKLNIIKTVDGIFVMLDGDSKFSKGTTALSHNISQILTPGITVATGNVNYELELNSLAIGVSSSALTVSSIYSCSLYSANIGKAINPRVDVVGSQMQFWFTDLNGVPVNLSELPNNSMIETLVSFA
jgi:hypothetical protein